MNFFRTKVKYMNNWSKFCIKKLKIKRKKEKDLMIWGVILMRWCRKVIRGCYIDGCYAVATSINPLWLLLCKLASHPSISVACAVQRWLNESKYAYKWTYLWSIVMTPTTSLAFKQVSVPSSCLFQRAS